MSKQDKSSTSTNNEENHGNVAEKRQQRINFIVNKNLKDFKQNTFDSVIIGIIL